MGSSLRQGGVGAGALPTFFIVGAAKAGTTSLHYYLDQHPQIQMSANKEPDFFSGPENGIPYLGQRVERLDEYEQLFDPTFGVRGEASVSYTTHPRRVGVPERIKELVPGARFIYLVRDPIARTLSQYHQRVAVGGERRSLQEVLSDLSDPYSVCICRSLYATQLDLYLRQFSQERVLVVDQADLLADRQSTLREVFDFLSVDDTVDSSRFDVEFLKSSERRMYPFGLARFMSDTVRPHSRWVPQRVRQALRLSMERILLPPLETSKLDDELRSRLQELYAGEVQRLRALTGKTFPTWSV
jgi:Sulfotransferase domain